MTRTLATALLSLLAASPLAAHHPMDEFDLKRVVQIRGVVMKVEWSNPHPVISISLKDGNITTQWQGELQSAPGALLRRGWSSTSVKVGDTIVVKGFPARETLAGLPAKLVVTEIRLPDGQTLDASSNIQGRGADAR